MREIRGVGLMAAALAALGSVGGPSIVLERPPERPATNKRVEVTRMRGPSRLNRSRHWEHAETYKEARAISPFPKNPIR